MQFTLDLGTIMTMAVAALVGIVWQNLNTTIARVERSSRDSTEKAERRFEKVEDQHQQLPVQLEKISREVVDRLARLELKLAEQHPTRKELEEVSAGRSEQLKKLWEKVDKLSDEVTHLVTLMSAKQGVPHHRNRNRRA